MLRNTGPLENLDIDLPFTGDRPNPVLLVGKNGCGKSTTISFIVNALVGMKQQVFDDVEVEKGRVYRLRSPLAINGSSEFYFARLSFDRGVNLTEWQLNRTKDKISDQSLMVSLDPNWHTFPPKETSTYRLDLGELAKPFEMEEVINQNCFLYFPADRFEPPDWLNVADLSQDLKLPEPQRVKGKTDRRIFSRNRLKPTLDWLNSVIFDMMVSEYEEASIPVPPVNSDQSKPGQEVLRATFRIKKGGRAHAVFSSIQAVLQKVLCDDQADTLRLSIGDRRSRILSATVIRNGKPLRYIKDLMGLSAGESALFCLFAAIIRDADLSGMGFNSTHDINGIVVIDEVDMHLHVGFQYRALSELIALFPRVQFILSAHAPMIAIGLENVLGSEGFSIIELPNAIRIPSESYSEFKEAFTAFSRTQSFQKKIFEEIKFKTSPILLLEGKSDAYLIKTAWSKLNPNSQMPFEVIPCGIEPDEEKRSGGATTLRQSLQFLSVVTDRPVCGLFDFDRGGYENFNGLQKTIFITGIDEYHKRHATKNVHGILLPVPSHRLAFVNKSKPIHSFLSIEHYFKDDILKINGISMNPIVADSKVFEIDANSEKKTNFAMATSELEVSNFESFAIIFDRLKALGIF